MRQPLLLALVLLTPAAAGASQVHVTYLGDAYAVTFVSNATSATVPVEWDDGRALATRVMEPSGDDDRVFRAQLPARALAYTVEGRTFTLPAPPRPDAPTRVAFVADVGTDANASAVLDAIARAEPDLLLVGGDLSYANGDARVWNEWFDLVEPLAARVPMMPAYGNHEDYCQEEDFSLHHCGPHPNGWHAHFALPNGEKLYYAFDWGPLRVTVLDTEAYEAGEPFTDAAEQEAFLDASLAADDEGWDVVMYHRPLRTTNAREGLASEVARDALAPRLDGRADLVLQAHLHAYERTKPQNGTVYVTSGGGGRMLYDKWGDEEPWLAERAAEFHFLLIEATPEKLEVTAVRPDGSTLDRFTLERPAPPTPPRATPTPTPTTTPITTPGATPAATPPATATRPGLSGGNGTITDHDAPAPGVLALLVALALVARRARARIRP